MYGNLHYLPSGFAQCHTPLSYYPNVLSSDSNLEILKVKSDFDEIDL